MKIKFVFLFSALCGVIFISESAESEPTRKRPRTTIPFSEKECKEEIRTIMEQSAQGFAREVRTLVREAISNAQLDKGTETKQNELVIPIRVSKEMVVPIQISTQSMEEATRHLRTLWDNKVRKTDILPRGIWDFGRFIEELHPRIEEILLREISKENSKELAHKFIKRICSRINPMPPGGISYHRCLCEQGEPY